MTRFLVPMLLSVCGEETEFEIEITGSYHAAYKARVPAGEYMPLEPDEPEAFECDTAIVKLSETASFDIYPLLAREQIEEIELCGIEEARAGMERDPDQAYDEMRDERIR